VSFAGADDWASDGVEFWLMSGCDVSLHRASHLRWGLFVERADRGGVDCRALRPRYRDRLFAAADKALVGSYRSEWRSDRRRRERKRSEEHELVPEQRYLVISATAFDTGRSDRRSDRFCAGHLDAKKRGALTDEPRRDPFRFDPDRGSHHIRIPRSQQAKMIDAVE
jgi:hypothetical protein